MVKDLKRIAVTGAAGQIAYSLLFRIAHGDLLGFDQPIALHLLEVPGAVPVLGAIEMELNDCAFPLLEEIRIGSNPFELFKDVDYALLIGAKPRGPGMERKDLLNENGRIFVEQGLALNEVANSDVKVFVVGNPCNTNCLITMSHAPRIPKTNFHAMTRLDQNRATFQLAKKAGVKVSEVSHVIVWGNHSSTQVPDFFHARIHEKLVTDVIQDQNWLEKDFIQIVQKRGAEIINIKGTSSAASAASALIDDVRESLNPSPEGHWFSSAVYSYGNTYGIADNLVFSFPCHILANGQYEIIDHLSLNDFLRSKLMISEKELIEERDVVRQMINM